MISYHPEKSRLSNSRLCDFIRKEITGDLLEVPGVSESNARVMRDAKITTTYGLIGKYLSLKELGVGTLEHQDRFYHWLKYIGTAGGFRAAIVQSIAEKCNIFCPGIYDENLYSKNIIDKVICSENITNEVIYVEVCYPYKEDNKCCNIS